MAVKWKTNNSLRPETILKKLEEIKNKNSPDEIDFSIEYTFALSALETMISFPKIEGINKSDLIFRVISKTGELKKDTVLTELNQLVSQVNAQKESVFHILTSLSLSNFPTKRITVVDCEIELMDKDYPEKYINARKIVLEKKNLNEAPSGYTKIIIFVKEKSAERAVTKALRCLDLQRAAWCLLANRSYFEFFGNEWEPINKIRLGEIHSVHHDNGELAIEELWFEPNFVKASSINVLQELNKFEENNEWLLTQLDKSKYPEELKNALLRYVRALDEKDQNSAVIKLWAAIESLTAPLGANGELITKRCSFIFRDFNFHKQVLEHLREYRNRYVHAGDQREEAKNICLQLQFYFRELILFHLRKTEIFSNLEEANEFLDLPPKKHDLIRKKELIESALSYVVAAPK